MLEASSRVVQVVTAGTDWPAVVAAIVTGVVAVLGIWGTSRQARRAREAASTDQEESRKATSADLRASLDATAANLAANIKAENMRAELIEKRRVYARGFTLLTTLEVANSSYDPNNPEPGSRSPEQIVPDALNAVSELQLIAPPELSNLAGDVLAKLTPPVEDSEESIEEAQEQLFRAMRADLGQPS